MVVEMLMKLHRHEFMNESWILRFGADDQSFLRQRWFVRLGSPVRAIMEVWVVEAGRNIIDVHNTLHAKININLSALCWQGPSADKATHRDRLQIHYVRQTKRSKVLCSVESNLQR